MTYLVERLIIWFQQAKQASDSRFESSFFDLTLCCSFGDQIVAPVIMLLLLMMLYQSPLFFVHFYFNRLKAGFRPPASVKSIWKSLTEEGMERRKRA